MSFFRWSSRRLTAAVLLRASASLALAAVFTKPSIPRAVIDEPLDWLAKQPGAEPEGAGKYFMKHHRDIWPQWAPTEVAGRIAAAL